MTPECGKYKEVASEVFLPLFDVFCDLLRNGAWQHGIFGVLHNKELNFVANKYFVHYEATTVKDQKGLAEFGESF